MLHTRESIIPNQVVTTPRLSGGQGLQSLYDYLSHADKGIRYSSLQTLANPPLPGYLGQVCEQAGAELCQAHKGYIGDIEKDI